MTLDEILAAHQTIIDAWYARWLAAQKARIDAVFAKKNLALPTNLKPRTEQRR